MFAEQKIGCSVSQCEHYKSGDMCKLNAIQVFPCDDKAHSGHDSICYSFQAKK